MITTHIDGNAKMLQTRIPEQRKVQGLVYGAHISMTARGWCGYYVRLPESEIWGVAMLSPASDELVGEGDDHAIVEAIRAEMAE